MTEYVSSGSEFIVNTFLESHQDQPRIARFSNGNYVVVWKSIDGETTDSVTIKAQIFDQYGVRIGDEFVVESHGGGMQLNPNVAVLADDSFVVTWQSEDSAYYGSTSTIAAQRFSSTGTAIGSEFAVNSSASAFPTAPAITSLANGGYVVTWDDFLNHTVRARVFAADGTPAGGEFVIGTYNGSSATSHTVQALAGGGFAAVWNAPDGSGQGVRVQLFTDTGAEASGEIWANSQTADNQSGASIVALTGGNFVVLWTSYNTTQDGSFSAIKAQMFDASGAAIGGEFLINQIATGYQVAPRATALADGGFMVGWQSAAGAYNSWDNTLRARVFDANGTATGDEFQIDGQNFTQTSYLGGLTTLSDGSVRVVYSTSGGDGDGDGILLRTLVPEAATQTAPTIVSNGGGATASVTVDEYTTQVTNLSAYDPDGPQLTTFSIVGGADAGNFVINALTGQLSFGWAPQYAAPGDADGDNIYEVTVRASDGSLEDFQTLYVSVSDIDETVTFSGPSQLQSEENQQYAGAVSASSAAGFPIYYEIVGGDDAALLTIDSYTGQLSFVTSPDFENPADANGDNLYDVQVMASNGVATATAAFVVQVQDVEDGSPFTSPDAVSLAENTEFVVTVQAVSSGEYFLYTITGGEDAGLFQISDLTGDLYFLAAPDYEAPTDLQGDNVYQVEVTAWGQPSGSPFTQLISITVQDIPDGSYFTSPDAVSLTENTDFVVTVQAVSSGEYFLYTVTGGEDAGLFQIDQQTGELQFLAAPDYEAPTDLQGDNVYQVEVTAWGQPSGSPLTQLISVTVQNEDEAPVFTSTQYPTIYENQTAVQLVQAYNPEGGTIVYSIYDMPGDEDSDRAFFTIDPNTGQLSFLTAPDFEMPVDRDGDGMYYLFVAAHDPQGTWLSAQAVVVEVANVNEAPEIAPLDPATALENITAVGILAATDPDGDPLVWAIAGGADAALFAIDAATGALSFVSAPDYEAPGDADGDNVYEITVSASDGSLVTFQAISVTLTNANEAPTITSAAGFAASENALVVGTIAAADPDGTAPGFAIVGGADAARFAIDAATGELSFVAAPDFEVPGDADGDNVYEVTVQASDGSLATIQAITVTLGNVNEAPVITSQVLFSAAENGMAVGSVTASDVDSATLTYAITGGVDAARFTIDAATGALAFIAAPDYEAPLDAGANNVYDVIVTASDGSLTASQALSVVVGNVNEAPTITSGGGGAALSVTRTEGASTGVTTLAATDPDGTPLTYTITGGADAARFTINALTGLLSFVASPNFEAPSDSNADNVYEVVVAASDGSLADSQTISVTITNVNENLAITSNGGGDSASITINENTTAVTTVVALDQDGTAPSYAITGGADASRFTINAATGALSFIAAPNFEAPTDSNGDNVYQVEVRASDGTYGDYQMITITIANLVDGLTLTGTSKANSLTGGTAEDTINGLGGNDTLSGLGGADTINGGDGADTIIGGAGADTLIGGLGADTFVYQALTDSSQAMSDFLTDFSTAQGDKISLSALDANANLSGDQAFSWIGTGAFSNVAGQLRYYQSGGDTFVTGDVNGDGVGDFSIRIDPLVTLAATNFVL